MNAEIISVGTELLLGDIVNTNAQYLSKQLALYGVSVYSQCVVGDNEERIVRAYEAAFDKGADLIITTGGLGPTKDDITKEVAAKYFGRNMTIDENSLKRIEGFFNSQNLKMTEDNKKQAYFAEGAKILENKHGTAPGCILEDNGKIIISLPGPPREMMPMFESGVIPFLKERQSSILKSKVLRLSGIGEGLAADKIADLLDYENPTVAPYAKTNEVHFRITANAQNEQEANKLIAPVVAEIYNRVGEFIYGEDEISLSDSIAKQLVKKNITIAAAESCTAGLLTSTLANYPGISAVLKEGFITYSNESKMSRLNVKEETLNNFGAVSHECAAEMAEGVAVAAGANIGISITGIAGPDGGTEQKPVGRVYIGFCCNGNVFTKEFNIIGDRERVRGRAVTYCFNELTRIIKDMPVQK